MVNIRSYGLGLAFVMLFVNNGLAQRSPDDQSRSVSVQSTSIQFGPELKAQVDRMLQRSATFREQYRRIADSPLVVVGVRTDIRLCETSYKARTTFRRYQTGLMVAAVAISPGAHQEEWIAHEFEHILEQLDGQNLPQMARSHAKDVWFSGSDAIETDRAIRVGRAVRSEMQQATNTR
jgi:hypothetical protein